MPAASGSDFVWEPLTGAAVSDNGNVRTVNVPQSAATGACLYRVRITKP